MRNYADDIVQGALMCQACFAHYRAKNDPPAKALHAVPGGECSVCTDQSCYRVAFFFDGQWQ
jgi:hypothetical protein